MDTAFDIQAARDNLHRRQSQRRAELSKLVAQAQKDVTKIVAMLIEKYQPQKIYQWGSLLTPAKFREWSDIDLALEGLTHPLAGLRAADDAQSMTTFPIDLVELERIDPRHAETIRSHGRLIYEKP